MTTTSPAAVEIESLGKTFKKKKTADEILRRPLRPAERLRALDAVSLSIPRGEIFGLLGPNGAGKTTLIKILSGLVIPTDGRASIERVDCSQGQGARRLLGLVTSDERSFYWRLTGRENLRFFGRLHGLKDPALRALIASLLDKVGLAEASEQRFSTYSSGMRQRLSVARALLHDPPVLLCDEPTRSLDPVAARSLRSFLRDELNRRAGKTILLATHNLHEAAALCHRIAILARGRVLAVDTPEAIRRFRIPAEQYRLELRGAIPGDLRIEVLGPAGDGALRVRLTLEEGERLGDALGGLHAAGTEILTCERIEPDIEEAFERIVAAGASGRKTGGGRPAAGEGP